MYLPVQVYLWLSVLLFHTPAEKFSLSFTSIKDFGKEVPATNVRSWKNESILLPIVIKKPQDGPSEVRLSISGSQQLKVEIAKLEYVLADLSAGACGTNKTKGVFKEALFPDRVNYLPDDSLKLEQGVNYFLAKVWIPATAPTGTQEIGFTVHSSESSQKISARIEVLERTLPDMEEIDFEMDFWQFPFAVASFHKVEPWSPQHMALLEEQFTQLKGINQTSITTSVFWDLYNGRPKAKESLMIKAQKKTDGSWEYDYTNFEKYVQLGLDCGIEERIGVHNLFPWNTTFFYIDEASQQLRQVKSKILSDEYKAFWDPLLRDFGSYLQSKGWLDKVVFMIDERDKDQSIALAKYVKSINPAFKMGYAGRFYADLSEWVEDYSLPSNTNLNQKALKKRKEANKRTTFYTACWEKQPNMLMMNNYNDFYFLLLLSEARGYDGFLRWAFNSWRGGILTDARYADVPSGDAHFVYPYNQPSIRYELLIDALQEVHKAQLFSSDDKAMGVLKRFTDHSLLGNEKARKKLLETMMNELN